VDVADWRMRDVYLTCAGGWNGMEWNG